MKIFIKEENSDYEIKGFREDVFILRNNEWFRVSLITFDRLKYEYEINLKERGYYSSVPNQVLLNAMDKETIINALLNLEEEGYFEAMKPCKKEEDRLVEVDYFKTIDTKELICIYNGDK